MASIKTIAKPKVTNALVGIKKSKRLEAINLNKSGRHYDEVQSIEISEIPPLNDDCLLDIFSFLPIRDLLYNVAVCSRQFKALAERAAQQKCRNEKFVYNYSNERDASIIRRFGAFMRDIDVYHTRSDDVFACSFTWLKHCTSLKALVIQCITLNYDRECAETLKNLENLTLNGQIRVPYRWEKDEDFVLACKNLKSITCEFVGGDVLCETILCVSQLVNIERIIFDCTSYLLENHQSVEIATKMAQMNKLNFLSVCGGIPSLVPFINALSASQSMEELVLHELNLLEEERLELNFMEGFDKFPNLRTCKLKYEWFSLSMDREEERYCSSHLQRRVRNFNVVETDSSILWSNDGFFCKTASVTLSRKN